MDSPPNPVFAAPPRSFASSPRAPPRPVPRAGPEDAHRRLLVRGLRALVLALHDDPGRQVRDADRAVGLVHVLPPGALRPVGVDLEVALVDLDVGVVGQERRDDHRRERGVAPVRAVERRLANEPVLAALGLQDAVGVLAADRHRRALQTGLLPRARLEQIDLEPPFGCPALVHPQHDLGPVLRVGAARARLQRDNRIAGVVFAVEQRRLLQPCELAPQRHDRRLDLGGHLRVELEQLAASSYSVVRFAYIASFFATRECSVEILSARSWSFQKPGSLSARLELGDACLREAGSKVITDPGELDPDLVELLLERASVSVMPSSMVARRTRATSGACGGHRRPRRSMPSRARGRARARPRGPARRRRPVGKRRVLPDPREGELPVVAVAVNHAAAELLGEVEVSRGRLRVGERLGRGGAVRPSGSSFVLACVRGATRSTTSSAIAR